MWFCHGIPNDKPLKDGDIVNVDVDPDPGRRARRFEPHVIRSAKSRGRADALIDVNLRRHDAALR